MAKKQSKVHVPDSRRVSWLAMKANAPLILSITIGIALIVTLFPAVSTIISTGNNTTVNTLGASDTTQDKISKKELTSHYQRWKEVVQQHPDYRDGLFTLATIAYQLGYFDESVEYLQKVTELDPNYPGIKKLHQALEKAKTN